jgi:hypothetical protein
MRDTPRHNLVLRLQRTPLGCAKPKWIVAAAGLALRACP